MPSWTLLQKDAPHETGDYLVYGIAGEAMQWVDHWNMDRFCKFARRKIFTWIELPKDNWLIYGECKPDVSARYLTFIHSKHGKKHLVLAYEKFDTKPSRFVREDSKVIAFQSLPQSPKL